MPKCPDCKTEMKNLLLVSSFYCPNNCDRKDKSAPVVPVIPDAMWQRALPIPLPTHNFPTPSGTPTLSKAVARVRVVNHGGRYYKDYMDGEQIHRTASSSIAVEVEALLDLSVDHFPVGKPLFLVNGRTVRLSPGQKNVYVLSSGETLRFTSTRAAPLVGAQSIAKKASGVPPSIISTPSVSAPQTKPNHPYMPPNLLASLRWMTPPVGTPSQWVDIYGGQNPTISKSDQVAEIEAFVDISVEVRDPVSGMKAFYNIDASHARIIPVLDQEEVTISLATQASRLMASTFRAPNPTKKYSAPAGLVLVAPFAKAKIGPGAWFDVKPYDTLYCAAGATVRVEAQEDLILMVHTSPPGQMRYVFNSSLGPSLAGKKRGEISKGTVWSCLSQTEDLKIEVYPINTLASIVGPQNATANTGPNQDP